MIVVAVSGGFDPLHPGHIQYLQHASQLGDRLLVILSRDDQLILKKGYRALPYDIRKAVVEWGLRTAVGEVVANIDLDHTSRESLRYYHPDIFAKGGDTWDEKNLPEWDVCQELGIDIMFGVGGYDKPYTSSELVGPNNPHPG